MKHSIFRALALIVALLMALSLVALAEEGLSVGEEEQVGQEIEEQYYEEEDSFMGFENTESAPVVSGVPVAREGLSYTGEPQALLSADGVAEGSILYALNGGEFTTAIPTAIDAGTYEVSYRPADGEAVTTLTVTIAMAEIAFIPPVANTEADGVLEAQEILEAAADNAGEQDGVWL